MKKATWRTRARRTFAVITSTALAGSLTIVSAGTATADEGDHSVTSGDAEWGVKQSFRDYITGPIAHGTIEVIEPAAHTEDGGFTFEATGGTVTDTATETAAEISFAGGVHFTGHEIDGVHALDINISNVAVQIDGDTGTLVADIVSREFIDPTNPGELQEYPAVEFGEIDLRDAPLTVIDNVASVTDAPMTLTADGEPAFGGFYEEGTELDPLSFSVDLAPAAVAPEITTQPADVSVDEGEDATFTASSSGTPEPTVQWQTRTDIGGEWADVDSATEPELTLTAVTAAQDGTEVRAVFANGTEPDAVTEAASLTVVPTEEPGEPDEPEFEPAIEVYAADSETELGETEVTYGDTVVVEGSGFDPAANVGGRGVPIPSDLPQGTYVVFGKFAEQWQPSAGASSDARVIGSQKWALAEDVLEQVPPQFQETIREQWVDIAEDGTFTAELEIAEPTDRDGEVVAWPEEGTFGIYTYGAGGVNNADQEQSAPVNVVDEITEPEEPTEPELTVTPTEDLAIDTVVTVDGTGYAPNRAISVAFTANQQQHEEFGWPMGWLNHEVVTTDEDGSFSREITVSGWVTGTGADCSEVDCYLATFNSAQASDVGEVDRRAERDQDAFVQVTFVAGYPPEPEPEPVTPAVSADPNPVHQTEELTVNGSELPVGTEVTALLEASTASATGALDWGIKESFRSYVTGPIAHGSIELSDEVTENADGTYQFPVGHASIDDEAGTSLLSFNGSVSFEGHEFEGASALEVHISNLHVQVTEDATTLTADVTSRDFVDPTSPGELVDYPDVVLATLDRDAFGIDGETVTATDGTATLTAEGAPAFAGFYDEGTELDPIDLEVSSASPETSTATTTRAAASSTELETTEIGADGMFETVWTVPAEFPAGAYAVVLRDAEGAELVSDPLTVLAAAPEDPGDGDEDEPEKPTEPGQSSVDVEPDPVKQGSTATFSGTDLTPGTSVGAVIDAAGTAGTLEWGVKESFRDYIAGNIAHGEIAVTAPATETAHGTFLFREGSGNGDARDATADFAGAVTFAGHEMNGVSALEITVTDPSVIIEDGAGHLVADVTSRSLDGDKNVDYPRVSLADLDLSGVKVDDGRLIGTDVPATLTAEGVPAFADFYEEGDSLDPVSFSVTVDDRAELDFDTLDVAAVTVDEDGTTELSWDVPADFTLGAHQVDLVSDGASVASTTFTVVADDTGAPSGPSDGGDDRSAAGPGGDDRLPDTGIGTTALAALAATVMLGGATLLGIRRRQRA